MGRLRGAHILAAGALALAAAGCGTKFKAPVEHPKPVSIPPPATFIKTATWTRPNWNPTSISFTNGLVLVAEDSARVQYYTSLGNNGEAQPSDLVTFTGLIRPVQVTGIGYDVFVADMGDGTPDHPATVYRYNYYTGGLGALAPKAQFTDTTWVRINGLAADLAGHLYVSAVARVVVQQPPNAPAIEEQSVIYRYKDMYPGAPRDTVTDQGTGIGTVTDAHAIGWASDFLYVADTGNIWGQQLHPLDHNLGSYKVDGGEDGSPGLLQAPYGATADGQGHFYISDVANKRIYRYNTDGSFDQIVNQFGADGMLYPAALTTGVTSGHLYVWVADPVAHLVNLYKFQR